MINKIKTITLAFIVAFAVSCDDTKTVKQFPDKIFSSGKAKYVQFKETSFDTINEGIFRKQVYGDNIQQVRAIVKKGFIIPKHHHVSEQMSTVLKGSFKVTIHYEKKNKEFIIKQGDVFFVPSNIPHTYLSLEDSEIQEVFYPVRMDIVK